MEVLYPRCAGLDVHAQSITACARVASGQEVTYQHRTVAATTAGLLELADWLVAAGCTHVAMEATGVYWKPVWHVLDGQFTLVLANAMHIRNVPGRKSDMNDATWIANLLAHGLIRGSFVPPTPIQELRDLTRTRKQLIGEITRHTQRIQKVLEDANVKLTRVVSDVLGTSGRAILRALIAGETCSSPYMRRSVRNSMGAIFKLPVVESPSLFASLPELRGLGVKCTAAHGPAKSLTLANADLRGDTCVVLGSEGQGLTPTILGACDEAVAIPMANAVYSLNVGNAAAVFLYEAARQRVKPVFGTHDLELIGRIRQAAVAQRVDPSAYEFHMLYGIRMDQQRRLAGEGYLVRDLIAYGEAWYPWYMRRLAERPANVIFALRQIIG